MKKILFACALFCAASITNAQVKMPAPSPTQTIKQDFGLSYMELTYSRPSLKGRKIFGGHEPYNEMWRTGANAATKIKFIDPVEIGGKKLDSGTYVIYTIPNKDMWEVIFNKGLTNWGTDGYKESEDVVRLKVPSIKMKDKVETMAMQFANIKPESCELHIMWEKTAIAIPIATNIKDRMRESIEKAMMGEKKPYWNAAQFYYEYDKDNAKALAAANGAVEANPKAFWVWIYKAKIEKAMGDKVAAMASSKKSLELAREAKNDTYIRDNEDLQKSLK
jgi:tetratricopeptide (TPR) repeat protein